MTNAVKTFPPGFFWGASTSSYQIEGSLDADGRGPDIWDTFTAAGKIQDGTNARSACDHYNLYRDDIALMKQANFNAYRFSIAWPRVIPTGRGAINEKGLDFYDRLVDEILKNGITPMACLYHWDLPQPLEDIGGWQSREMTGPFAEYAQLMAQRLGDRVKSWMMLNEPNVVSIFGYGVGEHAPGLKLGEQGILRALHHQNLAQGAALRAIAAEHKGLTLGTVTNIQPVRPDSDSPADKAAAIRWDAVWNRVTVDGLLRGQLPDVLAEKMNSFVLPGDLEQVRYPIDLLGINYYSRCTMKHETGHPFDVWWGDPKAERYTFMGWPVQPDGLYDLLMDFKTSYGNPAMFIAENGAAYDDVASPAGEVNDVERVTFFREHLEQVHRALSDGANVKGYLAWSLLDNFEWAFGLSKRFGIIRVDYQTQKRTPKASYRFLAEVAKKNALA